MFTKEQESIFVISASVALIYLADRTGFWLKEQKQFNPWTFTFLCLLTLGFGLLTVKRAENDLGILNRDQTDEWKGWMQSKSVGLVDGAVANHASSSRNPHLPLPRRLKDLGDL